VNVDGQGHGLVAARRLPAGATLVLEKAIAMVLDGEIQEAEEAFGDGDEGAPDDAGADSALLLLKICAFAARSPANEAKVARCLRYLFPRTAAEAKQLRPWRCGHAGLDRVCALALEGLPRDLRERLPHVIRYNAVDATTGGERFAYPRLPEARLSGVALFRESSLFNHSRAPNVARWHCGDVACFRTNREVEPGEALTVSYCAAPLLADEGAAATALAHFDFVEAPEVPVVPALDDAAQAALQDLEPLQRLEALEARDDALGADRLEALVQEAIARWNLEDASGALGAWLRALEVADDLLPANDEQLVALRVQAGKAAAAAGDEEAARVLFRAAAACHAVCFAEGEALFEWRYADDMRL